MTKHCDSSSLPECTLPHFRDLPLISVSRLGFSYLEPSSRPAGSQDFRFLDVFRDTLALARATTRFAPFFAVIGFGVAFLVAAFFTDWRLTGLVARVTARLTFIAPRFTFAAWPRRSPLAAR
jgi:hypothetical protein